MNSKEPIFYFLGGGRMAGSDPNQSAKQSVNSSTIKRDVFETHVFQMKSQVEIALDLCTSDFFHSDFCIISLYIIDLNHPIAVRHDSAPLHGQVVPSNP